MATQIWSFKTCIMWCIWNLFNSFFSSLWKLLNIFASNSGWGFFQYTFFHSDGRDPCFFTKSSTGQKNPFQTLENPNATYLVNEWCVVCHVWYGYPLSFEASGEKSQLLQSLFEPVRLAAGGVCHLYQENKWRFTALRQVWSLTLFCSVSCLKLWISF